MTKRAMLLLIAEHDRCHFEIQERPEGFYVWRFPGSSMRSTHDHLQDDLAQAKRCASEEWGVPEAAWAAPSAARPSRLARDPGA